MTESLGIRFDIIIPLYNRANLVGETLQSVLDQTYPNWSAYVVDDGSTDSSMAVARTFADRSAGRIHVVERPEIHLPGGSGARNYGASLGQAPYLIFLDSDDLLMPDALAIRAREVVKYPEADLVVFPSLAFYADPNKSGHPWNRLHVPVPDLIRFLNFDMPWHTTGPVWQRAAFESIGGFDESALCWQDWEVHVRALLAGLQIHKVADTDENRHHRYRIHDDGHAISGKAGTLPQVRNRLDMLDRLHPQLRQYPGAEWALFNLYYYEVGRFMRYGFPELAALFRQQRKQFPLHWRWWWRFNEVYHRLTLAELKVLGALPVPKLLNRLYNWPRLRRYWMGKQERGFMRGCTSGPS